MLPSTDPLPSIPAPRVLVPATGEVFRFVRTAEQTAGAVVEIEMTLPAGFSTGGERHPEQDEHLTVIEAQLDVEFDGRPLRLDVGEQLRIPRGIAHRVANRGADPVRVAVTLTPALATQEFFETYAGLARDGKSTARGIPRNPLQAAVWLHAYRREVHLTGPAAVAQTLLFPILAVLGRRLGYRPHHPRYRATSA